MGTLYRMRGRPRSRRTGSRPQAPGVVPYPLGTAVKPPDGRYVVRGRQAVNRYGRLARVKQVTYYRRSSLEERACIAVNGPWAHSAAWTPARGRKAPLAGDSVALLFLATTSNSFHQTSCAVSLPAALLPTHSRASGRGRLDRLGPGTGPGSGPGQTRNLAAHATKTCHSGRAGRAAREGRNLIGPGAAPFARSLKGDDRAGSFGVPGSAKIPDLGAPRLVGDDDKGGGWSATTRFPISPTTPVRRR